MLKLRHGSPLLKYNERKGRGDSTNVIHPPTHPTPSFSIIHLPRISIFHYRHKNCKINLTKLFTAVEKGLGGRNFGTSFHVTIGIKIYSNWDIVHHFSTSRRQKKKGFGSERWLGWGKNVTVIIYPPTPAFNYQFSIDHLHGVSIFSSSICTFGFSFHL